MTDAASYAIHWCLLLLLSRLWSPVVTDDWRQCDSRDGRCWWLLLLLHPTTTDTFSDLRFDQSRLLKVTAGGCTSGSSICPYRRWWGWGWSCQLGKGTQEWVFTTPINHLIDDCWGLCRRSSIPLSSFKNSWVLWRTMQRCYSVRKKRG